MIPDRDYYADKDGKLTDDPEKYARQIAIQGVFLDERVAQRFGIGRDTLVSTDEPNAPRRVTGRNESSVKINKAEEESEETQEPQEPAEAAEPTTEPKAAAKKSTAKKGEK